MLHGAGNFFPLGAPEVKLSCGNTLREFTVGDLIVPLIAYDQATQFGEDTAVGEDGETDETGRSLWPSSTIVASLLLRCRCLLGSIDVLELGSGSGFCGLVARQLARSVVMSDREPGMLELARRNLRLQRSSPAAPTTVETYGWAEGDPWPTERFGLVFASDVLYGPHQSMRTQPEELVRFVDLLEHSLAAEGAPQLTLYRTSQHAPLQYRLCTRARVAHGLRVGSNSQSLRCSHLRHRHGHHRTRPAQLDGTRRFVRGAAPSVHCSRAAD